MKTSQRVALEAVKVRGNSSQILGYAHYAPKVQIFKVAAENFRQINL